MSTPPTHLLPDYDPKSSKVAQLRNILLQHDVPFSSAAKKPELMSAYEAHIRPRAAALLQEVLAVRPSDAGILDGESQDGSSLHDLDTGPESEVDDEPPARKGKGRGKREPLPKAKVLKSRKSAIAAQPKPSEDLADDVFMNDDAPEVPRSKVRKSGVRAAQDPDDTGARLSPQKRRMTSAGPEEHKRAKPDPSSAEKDRRQSLKIESGGESGFSDFNPFQSGNEESPESKPRRRKSSAGPLRRQSMASVAGPSGLHSRKSMPATVGAWAAEVPRSPAFSSRDSSASLAPPVPSIPPQHLPPSPAGGTPIGHKFMAPLDRVRRSPPEVIKLQREYANLEREREEAAAAAERERERDYEQRQDEVDPDPKPEPELDYEVETFQPSVRWRKDPSPAQLHTPTLDGSRVEHRKTPAPKRAEHVSARTFNAVASGSELSSTLTPQRLSSAPRKSSSLAPRAPATIAVVKKATPPQPILSKFRLMITLPLLAVALLTWREEKVLSGFCDTGSDSNAVVRTRELSLALPSLPQSLRNSLPAAPAVLVAFLDASHLRPTCTPCPPHATCSDAAFLRCASEYVPRPSPFSLGGLIPLAPRCVPDTKKQLAVAEVASRLARRLRERRGEVVCERGVEKARLLEASSMVSSEGHGTEAWVYGLQSEVLEEVVRAENQVASTPFEEEFLSDVIRLAEADLLAHDEVVTAEVLGDIWLAATTADMPLSCRTRRAVMRHAKQHKSEISGVLGLVLLTLWLRSKARGRRENKIRVRELVQTALSQLRDQERRHYNDPVLAPAPYLAPSHLRDLVLQHVHSPARRQQLWKQVEKVVEGNANVRAKQVEHQGEEIRAWEWTGVAGAGDLPGTPGTPRMYPKLE